MRSISSSEILSIKLMHLGSGTRLGMEDWESEAETPGKFLGSRPFNIRETVVLNLSTSFSN